MGETKFTPGPWVADCDLPGLALKAPMVRARGCTIAEVVSQATAEANACLIAAAPDIYAALRDALDEAEDCTEIRYVQSKPHFAWRDAARAALAKAEGRRP